MLTIVLWRKTAARLRPAGGARGACSGGAAIGLASVRDAVAAWRAGVAGVAAVLLGLAVAIGPAACAPAGEADHEGEAAAESPGTDGSASPATTGAAVGSGEVVLYSSADDFVLRELVAAFEADTGLAVRLVGDTEATKTFGLVERLLSERDRPVADVWWSSEPFGTVRLAAEGVFEPYTSPAEAEVFGPSAGSAGSGAGSAAGGGGWPERLRGEGGRWYGFAQRARVIAYSPERVEAPPTSVIDLVQPDWADRIGIARPQFGTTRGHFAALLHRWTPVFYEAWLRGLSDNSVRLYDGNASVVRAIHLGEIDVGLTDTDDVWAAQRNGWAVGLVYDRAPSTLVSPGVYKTGRPPEGPRAGLLPTGPLVLPNTVALVRGGPNPANGRRLIDWLLAGRAERLLAESDSRNIPIHPGLAEEFAELAVPRPWEPRFERIAGAVGGALDLAEEYLE